MAFLASTFVGSIGASTASAIGMAGPITAGTAGWLGAGTILAGGAALYGATKIMGSMTPEMPSVPQTTAQGLPATPTIEQARTNTREDTLDLLRRKNAGTILTTPQGLLDTGQTVGKTLLGA